MKSPLARIAIAAIAAFSAVFGPTAAEAERLALVRDAEAEMLISDYVRPILAAAGLGKATIQIKIVNDTAFNAFVADSRHIFVNTGTIVDAETPNQLIGVLSHETGHLAAAHLVQKRQEISRMQILTALAVLGSAAAGVASGNGQIGAAGAFGSMQLSQRSMLAYAREQESAADIAAVRFLDKTGQSAKGMLQTFQHLAQDQLFASLGANPYLQTHPMPQERITQIEELARKSPYFDKPDSPDLVARHALMRAKFIAFTEPLAKVVRQYPDSDKSLPAYYARAIAAFRFSDPKTALDRTDELIRQAPSNPFFWEFKGQILYESGSVKAAIEPLRKAVSLAPRAGLIRVLYGSALVGSGDSKNLDEAISNLEQGMGDDPDQPVGFRQLAIAYSRKGDLGRADLASAQSAFASGDITLAKQYALRAEASLKQGTPAWLRADDIVTYKTPK